MKKRKWVILGVIFCGCVFFFRSKTVVVENDSQNNSQKTDKIVGNDNRSDNRSGVIISKEEKAQPTQKITPNITNINSNKTYKNQQERMPATKASREFLTEEDGDYSWSPNVFAVPQSDEIKPEDILGVIGTFVLIKSETRPDKSYQVVKRAGVGHIGYYTGEVTVYLKNKTKADLLEKFLKENSLEWKKFGRKSYIIKIRDVQEAISKVNYIREEIPYVIVDIKINTSHLRPN